MRIFPHNLLFADDRVIYRVIDSLEDSLCLQRDLNIILNWIRKWQMQLNTDKCVVLRHTRLSSPIILDYTLNHETHKVTEQHKYLGNIFHESMHWSHHIQAFCDKAQKSFGIQIKCSRMDTKGILLDAGKAVISFQARQKVISGKQESLSNL